MPVVRLRFIGSACLCLGTLAIGCVTTQEPAGTFANGGGAYGQPALGTAPPVVEKSSGGLFSPKKPDGKVSPKLYLAHAQYEEARGNLAASRKAHDEQKDSYAAARVSYQKALSVDEKSIDAIIGLARLDEAAGRVGDAEQGFLKAIRLDSASPRSLDAIGQFYANQNRWSEAIPTLERALSASPDDKDIRFHYGTALARSGQTDKAQLQLIEAVGPAAAHYNLGVILHDRGDLVGSEEQLVAAIVENPRLEQAQHWLREVRREQQEKARPVQAAAVSVAPLARPQAATGSPRQEQSANQR